MKALVLTHEGQVKIIEKAKPSPARGEVLVKIKAAALNHRDQWIREGKYPGIQTGITLGSDGAGIVEATGEGVGEDWLGKEVVINPNIDWGDNPAVQSASYKILGMPVDGTLAEYISVAVDRLAKKPGHLSLEQAAALPLGGLTAYRAVFTHGGVQQGHKVFISGIGGGVAQFAFQFALAAGASVWVSSGSQDKIDKAISLGAKGGFIYTEEQWHKNARKETGGFHLIIDSAGGDALNQLVNLLMPAGRLVFYGASLGVPSKLALHKLFWLQARLQGSTMGNDQEFKDMLQYIEDQQLVPVMEKPEPFSHVLQELDKMKAGQQFGKLVLKME